jgi:hypothetical protein
MKNPRGQLIKFIRDPRHDAIRILGAAVGYFSASGTPGAERIAAVIGEAIAAEGARLAGNLPITALEAITFAIEEIHDGFAAIEFLECWQHGDWASIRENWPNALAAPPASATDAPATTDHPDAEKRAGDDLRAPGGKPTGMT